MRRPQTCAQRPQARHASGANPLGKSKGQPRETLLPHAMPLRRTRCPPPSSDAQTTLRARQVNVEEVSQPRGVYICRYIWSLLGSIKEEGARRGPGTVGELVVHVFEFLANQSARPTARRPARPTDRPPARTGDIASSTTPPMQAVYSTYTDTSTFIIDAPCFYAIGQRSSKSSTPANRVRIYPLLWPPELDFAGLRWATES